MRSADPRRAASWWPDPKRPARGDWVSLCSAALVALSPLSHDSGVICVDAGTLTPLANDG